MDDFRSFGQDIWYSSLFYELPVYTDERTGDVIHMRVMGHSVVVLMSVQAISDLLDKRSSIYSDRIRSIFLCDL